MTRSKWKSFFFPFKKMKTLSVSSKKTFLGKYFKKNASILPPMVDKALNIYQGSSFVTKKISKDWVGYKIGEFTNTRSKAVFKKGK